MKISFRVMPLTAVAFVILLSIFILHSAQAQSCWACMHGCTDQQRLAFCYNDPKALRELEINTDGAARWRRYKRCVRHYGYDNERCR